MQERRRPGGIVRVQGAVLEANARLPDHWAYLGEELHAQRVERVLEGDLDLDLAPGGLRVALLQLSALDEAEVGVELRYLCTRFEADFSAPLSQVQQP